MQFKGTETIFVLHLCRDSLSERFFITIVSQTKEILLCHQRVNSSVGFGL